LEKNEKEYFWVDNKMIKQYVQHSRIYNFLSCIIPIAFILLAPQLSAQSLETKDTAVETLSRNSLSANIGYGSCSFRDASNATFHLWVSPVKLIGKGPYIDLLYKMKRQKKVHQIGFSLNTFGSFRYDSGIKAIGWPEEDRRTELRLSYYSDIFIFNNVLIRNFDIRIGPQIYIAYLNTRRNFSPDIRIKFTEGHLSPAFAVSGRFSLFRFLQFDMSVANGFISGLERTHHNKYGTMPSLKVVLGWLTDIELSTTCIMSKKIKVGLKYRRMDQGLYMSCLLYTSPSPRD